MDHPIELCITTIVFCSIIAYMIYRFAKSDKEYYEFNRPIGSERFWYCVSRILNVILYILLASCIIISIIIILGEV